MPEKSSGPRSAANGTAGRNSVHTQSTRLPLHVQAAAPTGDTSLTLFMRALARAIARGRPEQAALFARSAAHLVAQRGGAP